METASESQSQAPLQTKPSKVFVFIDAENVRNSCEKNWFKDLDYFKLYEWLTKTKGVSRVYIYVGIPNGDSNKEKKFKELQQLGYFVFRKKVMIYAQEPLKVTMDCPKCNNKLVKLVERHNKQKANCDAELTLDVINSIVRKKCDEIMVFSGDGDFARVYEYVATQMKKKVTVYALYDERTSTKIKNLAKNGIIKLLDLSSLFQYYAERISTS